MLETATKTLLSVSAFYFISYFIGRKIYTRAIAPFSNGSLSLQVSLYTFLGLATTQLIARVSCWAASNASTLAAAKTAAWLAGATLTAAHFTRLKGEITKRYIISASAFALACTAILLGKFLYALGLGPRLIDCLSSAPTSFIGTAEAGRYAAISHFIQINGEIPLTGQNTGQSLLSYLSVIGQNPASYKLALLFNSALSASLVWLFVFGLLLKWTQQIKYSLTGSGIFMLSFTSLSFSPVGVLDFGSPVIAQSYSDSLLGYLNLATIVVVVATSVRCSTIGRFNYIALFTCLAWASFSNPTNLFEFIIYLVLCLTVSLLASKLNSRVAKDFATLYFLKRRQAIRLAGCCLIILGFAWSTGSVLTPSSSVNQDLVQQSGAMSITQGSKNTIQFRPEPFQHRLNLGGTLHSKFIFESIFADLERDYEYERTLRGPLNPLYIVSKTSWSIETLIINGVRSYFYAILGLTFACVSFHNGSFFINYYRRVLGNQHALKSAYDGIQAIYLTCIFSIPLLFISFFLSMNNYKWELSKFSQPLTAGGMLVVSLIAPTMLAAIFDRGLFAERKWLRLSCIAACTPLASGVVYLLTIRLPLGISNLKSDELICYLKNLILN